MDRFSLVGALTIAVLIAAPAKYPILPGPTLLSAYAGTNNLSLNLADIISVIGDNAEPDGNE